MNVSGDREQFSRSKIARRHLSAWNSVQDDSHQFFVGRAAAESPVAEIHTRDRRAFLSMACHAVRGIKPRPGCNIPWRIAMLLRQQRTRQRGGQDNPAHTTPFF